MSDENAVVVSERKGPADHLATIEKHLADNDAKHSPVVRDILLILREAFAPRDEPAKEPPVV